MLSAQGKTTALVLSAKEKKKCVKAERSANMNYTSIVKKDGEVVGKPLKPIERKSKDGQVTVEDSLALGDTIFFELTGNVVQKTGKGFKVVTHVPRKELRIGNIFHNSKLFQPTIAHNGKPALEPRPEYNPSWEVYMGTGKTKKLLHIDFPLHYREYWTEQRRRCIFGHTVQGVWISGLFYFYLNFWRIRSKALGDGYIPPRFLDLDFDFFNNVEFCRKNNKNCLVLKRRQIGFSEKLACICAYFLLMYKACQVLIIGGEKKYSADTYSKMFNGLKKMGRKSDANAGEAFASRFLKQMQSGNPECKLGFLDEGVEQGLLSEAFCITTSENLQAMAGKNPALAVLDEYGLMANSNLVLEYLKPAMEEGGVMSEGKIVIAGGTGGEMGSGAEFMQMQFWNPTAYTFQGFEDSKGRNTGLFYGAQWYYVTDDSGNSYHYESEFIVRQMRKGMSAGSLLTYITQMPLEPEEAFLSKKETPFYSDELQGHNEILQANKKEVDYTYVRYDWIKDEEGKIIGVEQTQGNETDVDSEGDLKYPFEMTEPCRFTIGFTNKVYVDKSNFGRIPEENVHYKNLYYAGTDSYDQDKAETTKSNGAFAIYKGLLSKSDTMHHFPLYCDWRPSRREKFYEQTLMASIFWGCTNLIEHSKIMIYNTYVYRDFQRVLENKPQLLYHDKESDTSNKWGVDPSTKAKWEAYFKDYLIDYPFNIQNPNLTSRILKYQSHINSDVCIAMMLARLNYLNKNTVIDKRTSAKKENQHAAPLLGYVRVGGGIKNVNRIAC